MEDLQISLAGQSYRLRCEDGQSERLLQVAKRLETRMKSLEGSVEQNEARFLVSLALLAEDSAWETEEALNSTRKELESTRGRIAELEAKSGDEQELQKLLDRLKKIKAGLEAE